MVSGVVLLQSLTNLLAAPAAPGLPDGWELRRVRGVAPPVFAVTAQHTLAIASDIAAGFATYRLAAPLDPTPGALAWRWRTPTPLPGAVLRERARDDCPVRVFAVFGDGRIVFYSWGNREARGERFFSWTGTRRVVVVLRGAADADGSWHDERHDPFADYRRAFGAEPGALVAVGLGADSEQLAARTRAEVSDLRWVPDEAP